MTSDIFIFNDNLRQLLEKYKICTDRHSLFNNRIANGNKILVTKDIRLEPYTGIYVGNTFCSMGAFSYSRSRLYANYKIGRYCSLADNIGLIGVRHPYERVTSSVFTFQNLEIIGPGFKKAIHDLSNNSVHSSIELQEEHNGDAPIYIGHDVWIGEGVVLKPGIKIGQGAVIAQKSIVTHDVPPYSIWGGVPAKLIKMRFTDSVIEKIMKSEWWNYAFPHFSSLNTLDPIGFCEALEELKVTGLEKFEPNTLTFNDIVCCQKEYIRTIESIARARMLSDRHKILRRVIKLMVGKNRYKQLKMDPDGFFNNSRNSIIKILGRFYN